MIVLGPLLGIEGDYQYSIVVVLKQDTNLEDLELVVEDGASSKSYAPTKKDKLHSSFLFRFSFPVKKIDTTRELGYHVEHSGNAIANTANTDTWTFVVPGKAVVPKIGCASCNGDHKLLPDEMDPKSFKMWDVLWHAHREKELDYSFHALLLGGDQVYADPIWEHVEYFKAKNLLGWRSTKRFIDHKIANADLDDLTDQIEAFYEKLYLQCWSKPEVSRILASIPSMMMWDDHDIIDGWGSHPIALQECELFRLIFKIAKRYFELLQIRTAENPTLISNGFDYSQRLGFRNFEIIILDNRSQRGSVSGQVQVMSDQQYQEIGNLKNHSLFEACPKTLKDDRVFVFVVPVPVAHLDYKSRTEKWLKWIFKSDFRNSLNDDGLDHWDHATHKDEQRRLIDLMYEFGEKFEPKYVNIISGDVHSGGAGEIERTKGETRYVNQLVSSPIVYKPIGWFAQKVVDWTSNHISHLDGYKISVKRFGISDKNLQTVYERNFGFLYKAKSSGLKFYLTFEGGKYQYDWHQPRKFNPDK